MESSVMGTQVFLYLSLQRTEQQVMARLINGDMDWPV
jgi:hypothetical protein